MTVTLDAVTTEPGNAGHPLDEAPLPYWLSEPCPPWCELGVPHEDRQLYDDRLHSSAGHDIELSLEPPYGPDPAFLNAALWMHYRDRGPHVVLVVNDGPEVLLELAEARELARLLPAPERGWAPVTLTMMDPDDVPLSGRREAGIPLPPREAHFAAFPFSRPAVLAVSRVLDTVTVFTQVRHGDDQAPRYLAFTPAEAAELADHLSDLIHAAGGEGTG